MAWCVIIPYHSTMTREDPQMKIRLTDDLKTNIENAARQAGRSMNAEIVARLQQSFNLEPLKGSKRNELLDLINEAIDERLAAAELTAKQLPASTE